MTRRLTAAAAVELDRVAVSRWLRHLGPQYDLVAREVVAGTHVDPAVLARIGVAERVQLIKRRADELVAEAERLRAEASALQTDDPTNEQERPIPVGDS